MENQAVQEIVGSEIPRVFTPPLRELTSETSAGFSVIAFASDILGIELFPWQRWLLIHALELREDGRFRFRYIVVLVARQNGKSLLSVVLALWFMFIRCVGLVIGTAQNLDIAEEIWQSVVEFAEEVPELSEEIERVSRVNGKKSLELSNGSRYKVQVASRRGGRGLSGDLILLDELREQTNFDAWSAITKTMMARPNAIVWSMSNAGDASSVVLQRLRLLGHAALGDPDGIVGDYFDLQGGADDGADGGTADYLGLFEWSSPPGADPSRPETWAMANPSMGYSIEPDSLRAAFQTDPEDVFLTECLCQWVNRAVFHPFPEGSWSAGIDAQSEIAPDEDIAFGIDVSSDRKYSSVAVCGKRSDGGWHVEVIAYKTGTRWLYDFIVNHIVADAINDDRGTVKIAIQGRGCPASSLAKSLADINGIELIEVVGRDVAAGCGQFWDGVVAAVSPSNDGSCIYHRPQPVLDSAANTARTKNMGDGAWAWDRRNSPDDISPLVACTLAYGAINGVGDIGQNKARPNAMSTKGRSFALLTV